MKHYTLSNGITIPKVGFGTWQIPAGDLCYQSVLDAIHAGYRHIDTAFAYGNEQSVGQAIRDSGVDRNELFIVTKLPAYVKDYQGCKEHFAESMKLLGIDVLDLYLIHAPWPWEEVGKDCSLGNIEIWKAMIELYNEGKIRAIGVSNFQPEQIENIAQATGFYPHVNQIRFFIGNTQEHIIEYCKEHNILVEAYSPFATGNILNSQSILDMANKYHTSPSKICLAYCYARGTLPLPKSTHKERIIDNLSCDIQLSQEDIHILNQHKDHSLDRPFRS